jgi:hypothetical protein
VLLAVASVFVDAFIGCGTGVNVFGKFRLLSDLRKQHAVQEFVDFQFAGLNG